MNLHMDKDAFGVLLEDIHNKTDYRTDVLEKDYYVVLILEELAAKQAEGIPAYFKGGTALYKALRTTNRFSEDIDLSVDTRGCSRTQGDKRLDAATKRYHSLERNRELGKTNRSEVISVYCYEPLTAFDKNDALQRFGQLKIEATSFTISEPVEELLVSPMIYDLATDEQKRILESVYQVSPFTVQTITLERIFIDKLFAAEAYVRKSADSHRAFEAAKHIYDLAVMKNHPKISALLSDTETMKWLLDIRMLEEQSRLDGIPNVNPQDFTFFTGTETNIAVRNAYEIMQRQYVLRSEDRIAFSDACHALQEIHTELTRNAMWRTYKATDQSTEKPSVLAELQRVQAKRLQTSDKEKPKQKAREEFSR